MSLVSKLKEWRKDPILFVKEHFDLEPDLWQEDALKAFASGDLAKTRICLAACAGPGKTATLAWCAWYFLLCYGEKGEHPKGAAVSITQESLRNNFWPELSKWQQKSKLLSHLFTWTQTRIFANEHPETWFLSARSYPKSADMEVIGKTLSGLHGKYVAFFIDESGDIPPEIGKAAEQAIGETLQRNGFCKIIQAGNPISLDGLLYHSSKADNWHLIKITADPEDPKRTPRVSADWAQAQIDKYGKDDPWVMSYILGMFPRTSINALFPLDLIVDAMGKHLDPSNYSHAQKRLGVDVATSGMDSTIIFPRQGLAAFNYAEMRNANGTEVAARIISAKAKWGSETEYVDNTGGFGASVIDQMRLGGHNPLGIHFSSKATSNRYYNKRAEMFYNLKEWLERGGALPDCNTLKKELAAIQYSVKNGKLIIEEKEQIKKRLGHSTDRADALALTFATADMPATGQYDHLFKETGKVLSDYDPFARM